MCWFLTVERLVVSSTLRSRSELDVVQMQMADGTEELPAAVNCRVRTEVGVRP